MSDKILIIDFEDSFTYNIANILFAYEKNLRVVSHTQFFNSINDFILKNEKIAIILGPGPGHPDHFEKYFEDIKNIMLMENVYVMGICLGHQMMGRAHGYEVKKSAKQLHGQSIEIFFNGISTRVQRYNSLAVFQDGDEINICEYKNAISYQFHPESIGTEQNDIFFADLLSFIGTGRQ